MNIEKETFLSQTSGNDKEHLSQKSQEEISEKQWNDRYQKERVYFGDPPMPLVVDFVKNNWEKIKDGPFLDLGCGNGRNLLHLAREGLDAYGMDLSKESVDQLQKQLESNQLQANIQQASFYNLPYQDGSFSGGICINVLQHNNWEGAEKSFAELSRVLADEAPFLLTVRSTKRAKPEDREDLDDRGITFIPKSTTKAGIMIHHYSEEEIKELAEKNSLEIVDIQEKVRDKKAKTDDDTGRRGHWIVTFKRRSREEKYKF